MSFAFTYLADAFIQSDLPCIQAIHLYCQYVCSLGIEPTTFALLTHCSTTELQEHGGVITVIVIVIINVAVIIIVSIIIDVVVKVCVLSSVVH